MGRIKYLMELVLLGTHKSHQNSVEERSKTRTTKLTAIERNRNTTESKVQTPIDVSDVVIVQRLIDRKDDLRVKRHTPRYNSRSMMAHNKTCCTK